MEEVGWNSSYAERKRIAPLNGIDGYRGTADQNDALLIRLMNGELVVNIESETRYTTYYHCRERSWIDITYYRYRDGKDIPAVYYYYRDIYEDVYKDVIGGMTLVVE